MSVNILIEAYKSDKLISGACDQCAVGNLLQGYNHVSNDEISDYWYVIVKNLMLESRKGRKKACKQLSHLPYNVDEILLIEDSFEKTVKLYANDKNKLLYGVESVLSTLIEIHGINPIECLDELKDDDDINKSVVNFIENVY